MSGGSQEQRNPYKGTTPRPWVRVQIVARDGSVGEVELIADTGNPYGVIIGAARMARVKRKSGPVLGSNFGLLAGGWLRVVIPDVGFDDLVFGCGSDAVVMHTKQDSPDFEGLVGLPLLRMLEYGGDADWFWIRPQGGTP